MADPLTLSLAAFAFAQNIGTEVLGGEAHHFCRRFLEQWRESPIDSATGLPRNHDLHEASISALREAMLVLAAELAGRIQPGKSWLARWADQLRQRRGLAMALLTEPDVPHLEWLDTFFHDIRSDRLRTLHDSLQVADSRIRDCLDHGNVCELIGPSLADAVIAWAPPRTNEHPDFEPLVRTGWDTGANGRVTLAQVYSLFLREHLKRNAKVFRIVVTDTLREVAHRIDAVGDEVKSEIEALRKEVALSPVDIRGFEEWLEPQLGAIGVLLGEVREQLDTLARGHEDIAGRQGEMLVALATFRMEAARGNEEARAALQNLGDQLADLEIKFERLIAGVAIQPFRIPEQPEHYLELLQANHRAVELVGRQRELESLQQWLETSEAVSARLLTGRAGSGKSRLAYELLLRVQAEQPHWRAGLVSAASLRKFDATRQASDWRWREPTLIVIDHAQSVAGPLAELLRALTHKRRANLPPLRILLLEREAGQWFESLLAEQDDGGPCAVRKLFDPREAMALVPLPAGDLRHQIFLRTLKRAAALAKVPVPVVQAAEREEYEAWLRRDVFEQPLLVMLAALAAVKFGLQPALSFSRIELAEKLAAHELLRLGEFARVPENAAQKRALSHLAACATMERGFTSAQLRYACEEELSALGLKWPDGPGDLAVVLEEALGSERWAVAPVEPDFVGEALVLTALAKPGKESDRWGDWCRVVERCFRRDPLSSAATLIHAFQNFGHGNAGGEYGESLLAALDCILGVALADNQHDLLSSLEAALPDQSVELRARAVRVSRALYLLLKRNDAGAARRRELSLCSTKLAKRLREAGELAQARELAAEAVGLARELAARDSAATALLPGALWEYANCCSALGLREEALAFDSEALERFRDLARLSPGDHEEGLLRSMNNVAVDLSDLGRHAEARRTAEEALKLARGLETESPGRFQRLVVHSLHNISRALDGEGDTLNGWRRMEEALAMRRKLATANPDAFLPDLALSLHNAAISCHNDPDRRSLAIGLAEEAVRIRRKLAEVVRDVFEPELAASLGLLVGCLRQTDRIDEAIAMAAEAVALRRRACRRERDDSHVELARAMGSHGETLLQGARYGEARAAFAEALRVQIPLYERKPDDHSPLMQYLAVRYLQLSRHLGDSPDSMLLEPVIEVLRRLSRVSD